jgi:tetratricopeptide (TPR) repeat protein
MIKIRLVKYLFVITFALLLASVAIAETEPSPKELEQEVGRYTALLQHDGDNAKYLNDLGFAYFRLHRIPEALTVFLKAIASDPACAITYNNLGAVYLHLKEYAKAEEAFNKALKLDPHYTKAAYNLSVSLYRQKKFYDAYKAYQQAKKIDADYVKKRFNDSHARDKLHEELKKDPNNGSLQAIIRNADTEK